MHTGIWLRFIANTNEHIIETEVGALKCRAIRRYDETEQFNGELINKLKGTPWQHVPGRDSLKIPTNTGPDGQVLDEDGHVEGYAEEEDNLGERFNSGADPTQDESVEQQRKEKEQEEIKEN